MTNTEPNLTYSHTSDMGEISGFGGAYEETCQKMLDAGVRWSIENPGVELQIRSVSGVMGLVDCINDHAKALEKAILAVSDPSGAMMHTILERVFFVHHNGWEEYCKQIREFVAQGEPSPNEFVDMQPSSDDIDAKFVNTLQEVFGPENVFVIETAEDVDAAFGKVNKDEPK